MIEIQPQNIFHGPSPFSKEPVVVSAVRFGPEITSQSSCIREMLCQQFQEWLEPPPTPVDADEAAQLVQFILDVSIAALTYVQGDLTSSGFVRTGLNDFQVWIGFHSPKVTHAALGFVARQCVAVARGKQDVEDSKRQLSTLWNACRAMHPDIHVQVAMQAARAHSIPWMQAWSLSRHWQFGWGERSEVIYISASNADGYVSSQIIANKKYSKIFLDHLGFPTPADVLVNDEADLSDAVAEIGYPCVVKPADNGSGVGVSTNLKNIDEVRSAYKLARSNTRFSVLVEQFIPGSDHRLLVVGGRLVAVLRKDPPAVTGDGNSSVEQLVERLNIGRMLPGIPSTRKPSRVVIDDASILHLHTQGLSAKTVIEKGRTITLRGVSNMKSGGSSYDVTDSVHPEIRVAAELIARTLDVNMTGFDYVTTDISRSWREVPGAFIELNLTPGQIIPMLAGWSPIKLGEMILGSTPGRIPITCVVVPGRQRAHLEDLLLRSRLREAEGWASHDKARLGDLPLQINGRHPWSGVVSLLSHKSLKRALLIAECEHIQRFGFPIDRVDQVLNLDAAMPCDWLDLLQAVSVAPILNLVGIEALQGFAGDMFARIFRDPASSNVPPL